MNINFWAVLVCAVVSMILGMIWYGPLFGRKWMEVMGMDPAIMDDKERCKEMGKGMGPTYVTQFILSATFVYVLALFINVSNAIYTPVCVALWMWIGFVVPVIGSEVLWGMKPGKLAWTKFLLQAGYQLIFLVISAWVISIWK